MLFKDKKPVEDIFRVKLWLCEIIEANRAMDAGSCGVVGGTGRNAMYRHITIRTAIKDSIARRVGMRAKSLSCLYRTVPVSEYTGVEVFDVKK